MVVENYVATPLLCTKQNGATTVRLIEITASRLTDYWTHITPNIMIKLACTKYLVRVRRVCETYSWQLAQVASTSEISNGIGHDCTTRSLCSPSENDEYESTKQNKYFKITMRRQLPASRRPLKGGRAATKEPPHLHSLNNDIPR